MSVDISVGFRFKEVYSFEEALIWVKNHRAQILLEAKSQFQKHVLEQVLTQKLAVKMAESELPYLTSFTERAAASQYPASLPEAIERVMSTLGDDVNDNLKTKSSIVVLPASKNQTNLFGLFTSNPSIRSFFESHTEIESYRYHSGVDSGNNVSPKEWRKRGAEWEKVLKTGKSNRYGSFAENGVEIEILNEIEIRLFNCQGMPVQLDENWYDLNSLATSLGMLSDLSVVPGLDQLEDNQKGEAMFRYIWKLLSGRVREFEEYKGLVKEWIKNQDLNSLYQDLIKDIRID